MDALADLLRGARASSSAFCRAVLEPPWALRIADHSPLALATTLRGRAWLVPDSGEPVLMNSGDVAVIKGPDEYTVADEPHRLPEITVHPGNRLTSADGVDVTETLRLGPRTAGTSRDGSTVIASGTYPVDGDVSSRLRDALPQSLVVPAAQMHGPLMDLLIAEVDRDDPGQQIVLDRLLDLMLIATLRAWFARPEAEAPGWYRAQSDPVVGAALRAIHGDPAHAWTIATLARQAGTSRATLARRFTDLVGEPPMSYLTAWRISLAADLLRQTDATVDSIARQVGYATAFALSVAFKRVRGVSPSRYRATRLAA